MQLTLSWLLRRSGTVKQLQRRRPWQHARLNLQKRWKAAAAWQQAAEAAAAERALLGSKADAATLQAA